MSGIGPAPENLVDAFLNEQSDASHTASDLASLDGRALASETPNQLPFYDYLTAAAAARNAAAANAQTQLDAEGAAENAVTAPTGLALTQLGLQEDALQTAIATDDDVATSLTGLGDAIVDANKVAAIQRFKLDITAENADFAALAKVDGEAGITLGMLDTNA